VGVTVTKGTAPGGSLIIDPANNHITSPGFSYDGNGNLTAMPGLNLSYDYDNRLVCATTECYGYDPENRRVVKQLNDYSAEVYFYGVGGEKLATYRAPNFSQPFTLTLLHIHLSFAGRVLKAQGQWVATDRLGSVRARNTAPYTWESFRYFPWGEEQTTTAQNRDKFATYFRDASGLDYALNRYYSSSHGRFLTPDPYVSNDALRNPQSWNRYSYVENDPVNFLDPTGLERSSIEEFMGCVDAPFGGPWTWRCDPTRSAEGGTPRGGGGGPIVEEPRGGGGTEGGEEGEENYRPECDRSIEKNKTYLDFIEAYRADAQELAEELDVPTASILGLSAEESQFGKSNIAQQAHNFFGLHAPAPGQTDVYVTRTGVSIAAFPEATGFRSSGESFVKKYGKFVTGVSGAEPFAAALHGHGFGVGNPQYVADLTNVIKNTAARIDCP
jgi:RHS repeat-associated protein